MSWTIAALILHLALIPELISIIYSLQGFIKTRYLHFGYMTLTWLFLFLGNFFIARAYISLDFVLYRIGINITAPTTFAIMMLVDSISYNHVDPKKLFIVTFSSAALFIYSQEPDSIVINTTRLNETTLALQGNFMIAGSIIFLLAGLFWLYYMIKIHINVPKHMKKVSYINLIGAVLAGPGSIFAFASGIVWYLPGTDYFFIGLGALFCSYSFHEQPKLGFILPFKVHQLLIIHRESSIPLYIHNWFKAGFADSTLFAGALSGISSILRESLNKWTVRIIQFDEGILMIQSPKDSPVLFVLITSKRNSILDYSLSKLTKVFLEEYGTLLKNKDFIVDLNYFKDTKRLVEENFPYAIYYEDIKDKEYERKSNETTNKTTTTYN